MLIYHSRKRVYECSSVKEEQSDEPTYVDLSGIDVDAELDSRGIQSGPVPFGIAEIVTFQHDNDACLQGDLLQNVILVVMLSHQPRRRSRDAVSTPKQFPAEVVGC